ncbi:MAG: STAS domain-containing protein [Gemmatimonadetes bacterium]|nr:STAS domain-containing protein [Gemmatimonadota bacterium]
MSSIRGDGLVMGATAELALVEAPSRLVAETRVDFRSAAMDGLERAAGCGESVLRIEMGETSDVDASGLGTLVVVQKRARERGLQTILVRTQGPVRSLLAATRLEGLFEFQ